MISACLLGLNCTFSGKSNRKATASFSPVITSGLKAGLQFIPACPEQLGGLATPRPPAEILPISSKNGRISSVKTALGDDVTAGFKLGASETLAIMKSLGIRIAVLKARSPSCGLGMVHSGHFNGELVPGNGITTDLLLKSGMKVFSDEEFIDLWQRNSGFDFISTES